MELISNVKDTALIFEGGGMRASYTAGFLNNLLENEIYFDYVAGISAGASSSVNYIARDTVRAKRSFVDLVLEPDFGGWRSFLKGEGFFRSQYIYEETAYPDAPLPLDFNAFMANPAKLRIGAFERSTGEMVYYSKDDIHTMQDLMKIVRASSSMPIFMPPTHFRGRCFVDGGISGGIALDIAKRDACKKFFVVLTRPKGYRKTPAQFKGFIKAYYRKHPLVAEAMLTRHTAYNETLDELEQLQSEGKAFLVYPDVMPVSNREINYEKLTESYRMGYSQGRRDVHRWKEFLELD
ncbi:phospholipase, patatin family (plasmid) [Peptoclostridium acidaminophilum DSM 3953]|uniref:Phospholipase, patatin family n=1 Tax=Peptoclostridium acidaminophilum DSM 3953 TaxID=1286171 RepID=W8TB45_PEPAC|nr:patatin family protein [Peptoclostridium acidaminophilum]AHM58080.1 phospholipase, patatin family [Peptoclostridium acidaminophilum DSM 3953]